MSNALGIDVNHYVYITDVALILANNISFVGIKCTEGTTVNDSQFLAHRNLVRSQPFALVIYYHLARTGDPVAQAHRFLETVGELHANERLALDTERTSTVSIQWIDTFYSELPTDRRHILYTSAGVWTGMGNPEWSKSETVDLWLPRYGSAHEPVKIGRAHV